VVSKILLASPRGYCAGVERAVETVEKALDLYGAPVYVRKQIVHNMHVVRDLEARGAVFVDEETEVPEGATVVFSAHGVAPSVHANAGARRLTTIDATCPLVTKVHVQARRYAADGYTVLLIGHAGHEEVVGTIGEAPDSIVLVESLEAAEELTFPTGTRLAYVTQTTLSVDETSEIISALRRRFPEIYAPKKEDICYATSNRQWAVKEMLAEVDLLLVIGSRNSSNSNRLVEVARAGGVAPDRRRHGDRRKLARRRAGRRHHLGRVGAGEARPARLRLVSRARRHGHRAVRARRRGRRVPPAGRAAPRARARRRAEFALDPLEAKLARGQLQAERLGGEPLAEALPQVVVGNPEADPVGDLEPGFPAQHVHLVDAVVQAPLE
jgi:4-hydroxy-3-methylbut-2-en-1-yl diphosphate reductase